MEDYQSKCASIVDSLGTVKVIPVLAIYGFMRFHDAERAVNYGAAHGALAMTTPEIQQWLPWQKWNNYSTVEVLV